MLRTFKTLISFALPTSISLAPIKMVTKTVFTAEDYRKGRCTSKEFHRQFVDETVLKIVAVGIGERAIKKSKDRYFNDIEIRQWDLIAPAVERHVKTKAKELGAFVSIALLVCIEKEAAEQIRSGGLNEYSR